MPETPLGNMNLNKFVTEVSTASPAPGGGSVAALAGALSAALSSMVAALTHNKKGYESVSSEMVSLGNEAQELMQELLAAVDQDTAAFKNMQQSFRLPKTTDEEKSRRASAIEAATQEATRVPFKVLQKSQTLIELATRVATAGNQNSLSDAGVAGLMAHAAALGAYYNVLINLSNLSDKKWADSISKQAQELNTAIDSKIRALETLLISKLSMGKA